MIVRVLHEGQYELGAEELQRVNELDEELLAAVVAGDETAFRRLLNETVSAVKTSGRPLAVEDLRPSDLVLPASDSSLEEVQDLFRQEGLLRSP